MLLIFRILRFTFSFEVVTVYHLYSRVAEPWGRLRLGHLFSLVMVDLLDTSRVEESGDTLVKQFTKIIVFRT